MVEMRLGAENIFDVARAKAESGDIGEDRGAA
jgi:hypothetical protein